MAAAHITIFTRCCFHFRVAAFGRDHQSIYLLDPTWIKSSPALFNNFRWFDWHTFSDHMDHSAHKSFLVNKIYSSLRNFSWNSIPDIEYDLEHISVRLFFNGTGIYINHGYVFIT
jgi:hypothetical protein